jgi:quercetin dioxygenase-like cupin family protein
MGETNCYSHLNIFLFSNKVKKMTAIIIIGILLLPVVYHLLFPFRKLQLENYFSPGYTFYSKGEGVTQTVIKQEGNRIYAETVFEPNAIGPPEHLHENINESATVIKGTLTTKVNGKITRLSAGDRLYFPKGILHKMYNETSEEVILRSEYEEDFIPAELAWSLQQLYPLMSADGKVSMKLFAKICVLDNYFDTVLPGPPPFVFKMVKKMVKPYARLFGVTPYDEKTGPG